MPWLILEHLLYHSQCVKIINIKLVLLATEPQFYLTNHFRYENLTHAII